jgi:hypothetical protein
MIIYISGKITGDNNYINKFIEAENKMQHKYPNAVILNPVRINENIKNGEWKDYMKQDIRALLDSTHIYFMKDYIDSKGALLEMSIAEALGILPIFEVYDDAL